MEVERFDTTSELTVVVPAERVLPRAVMPVTVKGPTTVDEACDTKPFAKVARLERLRMPRFAVLAKRFVELEVVAKRLMMLELLAMSEEMKAFVVVELPKIENAEKRLVLEAVVLNQLVLVAFVKPAAFEKKLEEVALYAKKFVVDAVVEKKLVVVPLVPENAWRVVDERMSRLPSCAVEEKRFVLDAVVAKLLVEVALPNVAMEEKRLVTFALVIVEDDIVVVASVDVPVTESVEESESDGTVSEETLSVPMLATPMVVDDIVVVAKVLVPLTASVPAIDSLPRTADEDATSAATLAPPFKLAVPCAAKLPETVVEASEVVEVAVREPTVSVPIVAVLPVSVAIVAVVMFAIDAVRVVMILVMRFANVAARPFVVEVPVIVEEPAATEPSVATFALRLVDEDVVAKRLIIDELPKIENAEKRLVEDAVVLNQLVLVAFVKPAAFEKKLEEVALYAKRFVVEAFVEKKLVVVPFVPLKLWSVVEPSKRRLPSWALEEKRLDDDAVVAKRFVDVALVKLATEEKRFVTLAFVIDEDALVVVANVDVPVEEMFVTLNAAVVEERLASEVPTLVPPTYRFVVEKLVEVALVSSVLPLAVSEPVRRVEPVRVVEASVVCVFDVSDEVAVSVPTVALYVVSVAAMRLLIMELMMLANVAARPCEVDVPVTVEEPNAPDPAVSVPRFATLE